MNAQIRPLVLVGLLALAMSANALGQGPANTLGERDPWLSQTIARQGNEALAEIRAELRIALRRQSQAATVSTMAGIRQGATMSPDCACGVVADALIKQGVRPLYEGLQPRQSLADSTGIRSSSDGRG